MSTISTLGSSLPEQMTPFRAWVSGDLSQRYGSVMREAVPDEMLQAVARFRDCD